MDFSSLKKCFRGRGCRSVAQGLPSLHKALGSISNTKNLTLLTSYLKQILPLILGCNTVQWFQSQTLGPDHPGLKISLSTSQHCVLGDESLHCSGMGSCSSVKWETSRVSTHKVVLKHTAQHVGPRTPAKVTRYYYWFSLICRSCSVLQESKLYVFHKEKVSFLLLHMNCTQKQKKQAISNFILSVTRNSFHKFKSYKNLLMVHY